jgi:hypothetical protein
VCSSELGEFGEFLRRWIDEGRGGRGGGEGSRNVFAVLSFIGFFSLAFQENREDGWDGRVAGRLGGFSLHAYSVSAY